MIRETLKNFEYQFNITDSSSDESSCTYVEMIQHDTKSQYNSILAPHSVVEVN